jgi:hypothetical protein
MIVVAIGRACSSELEDKFRQYYAAGATWKTEKMI